MSLHNSADNNNGDEVLTQKDKFDEEPANNTYPDNHQNLSTKDMSTDYGIVQNKKEDSPLSRSPEKENIVVR